MAMPPASAEYSRYVSYDRFSQSAITNALRNQNMHAPADPLTQFPWEKDGFVRSIIGPPPRGDVVPVFEPLPERLQKPSSWVDPDVGECDFATFMERRIARQVSTMNRVEASSIQPKGMPISFGRQLRCKVMRPIPPPPHKVCEWKPRRKTLPWSNAASSTEFDAKWERAFAKWFTLVGMAGTEHSKLASKIEAQGLQVDELHRAMVSHAFEDANTTSKKKSMQWIATRT